MLNVTGILRSAVDAAPADVENPEINARTAVTGTEFVDRAIAGVTEFTVCDDSVYHRVEPNWPCKITVAAVDSFVAEVVPRKYSTPNADIGFGSVNAVPAPVDCFTSIDCIAPFGEPSFHDGT